MNIFVRYSVLFIAFGLSALFETLFTIEWSFPYCMSQKDGPASAVFGMPFPYIRWSQVSSMEYIFIPAVYALNILVLTALLGLLLAALSRLFAPLQKRKIRIWLGMIGILMATTASSWNLFKVALGIWRPRGSISSGMDPYTDLRPVRFIANDLHYQCTPAPGWFSPDGQHR